MLEEFERKLLKNFTSNFIQRFQTVISLKKIIHTKKIS